MVGLAPIADGEERGRSGRHRSCPIYLCVTKCTKSVTLRGLERLNQGHGPTGSPRTGLGEAVGRSRSCPIYIMCVICVKVGHFVAGDGCFGLRGAPHASDARVRAGGAGRAAPLGLLQHECSRRQGVARVPARAGRRSRFGSDGGFSEGGHMVASWLELQSPSRALWESSLSVTGTSEVGPDGNLKRLPQGRRLLEMPWKSASVPFSQIHSHRFVFSSSLIVHISGTTWGVHAYHRALRVNVDKRRLKLSCLFQCFPC